MLSWGVLGYPGVSWGNQTDRSRLVFYYFPIGSFPFSNFSLIVELITDSTDYQMIFVINGKDIY